MTEEEKAERANMNWPAGLKDRVKELVGARGITQFTVEAVEQRLSGEDVAQALTKEVDELRYFTQLVLDRYVMGGDHENREAFLMELDLPAWLRTDGWPADLAKLVPVLEPKSEPVLTEEQRTPTQPPAPITGVPARVVERGADEVKVLDTEGTTTTYSEADLHAPSYAVAQQVAEAKPEKHAFVRSAEGSGKVCMDLNCALGPDDPIHQVETPVQTAQEPQGRDNPAYVAPSSDFLARVQAKAKEKGIDVSGAGLVPASKVATPEKPAVHNHAWVRHDDGLLHCDCGAKIEEPSTEHPTGVVREAAPEPEPWPSEVPTEPAPALEVPAEAPTPVAPPAPTRSLDDFDVDF